MRQWCANYFVAFLFIAVILSACGNRSAYYLETSNYSEVIRDAGIRIETYRNDAPRGAETAPVVSETVHEPEPWQIAYAALFPDYAPRMPGRSFILHDINRDGTPELIVLIPTVSNNWFTTNIYTLIGGEPVQLEIENSLAFHGHFLYSPLYDSPGIIKSPVDGNYYTSLWLMTIDGHRLVTKVSLHKGSYVPYGNYFVWEEEHWHVNGESVVENEFKNVYYSAFGSRNERQRLYYYEITEASIRDILFGEESQVMPWQEIYAEILRNYHAAVPPPDEWHRWGLFLHDVDLDGVPEIFITYMNAGIWSTAIYTFADGELIAIEGSFFAYYGIYPPRNRPGIIIQAYGITDLMVLDEGKLVTELALRQPFMYGDEEHWYINGARVTKDEFDELFNSIMPEQSEANIWPSAVNEDNIRSIIFGWVAE